MPRGVWWLGIYGVWKQEKAKKERVILAIDNAGTQRMYVRPIGFEGEVAVCHSSSTINSIQLCCDATGRDRYFKAIYLALLSLLFCVRLRWLVNKPMACGRGKAFSSELVVVFAHLKQAAIDTLIVGATKNM